MELFDSFVRDFTRKPSQDVNSDDHHDGGSYYYEFIINYFHGGFHSEHAPPPTPLKRNQREGKPKDSTYFERDRVSGTADDVDDVLARRRLHVASVDFEEPVAGQETRVQRLVAGHGLGKDHGPFNGTEIIPIPSIQRHLVSSFSKVIHVSGLREIIGSFVRLFITTGMKCMKFKSYGSCYFVRSCIGK